MIFASALKRFVVANEKAFRRTISLAVRAN